MRYALKRRKHSELVVDESRDTELETFRRLAAMARAVMHIVDGYAGMLMEMKFAKATPGEPHLTSLTYRDNDDVKASCF